MSLRYWATGIALSIAILGGLRFLPEWSVGEVALLARDRIRLDPLLFWLPAFGALLALLLQVLTPFVVSTAGEERRSLWTSRSLFLLLSALTVFLFRWPVL